VDLPVGQVVAGDGREPGRHLSAWKQPGKLADDAWAKAQRGQVVLVDTGRAGKGDGGKEILERFVLLPLEGLFAVLGFLQTQVILQAAAYRIV